MLELGIKTDEEYVMKKVLMNIKKTIFKLLIGIWDFVFYIVGAPYEQQAKKLDAEKADHIFRGPANAKSDRTVYRANKTSKPEKKTESKTR